MLYIFQVDTGEMIHLEMDVAISTVATLKSHIHSLQGIPVDKQILIVSGGEILQGSTRVCNYGAGTDTNPIFLFNRLNIEQGNQQQQTQQHNQHANDQSTVGGVDITSNSGSGNVNVTDLETLSKQVNDASTLPPTYISILTRTQLASHIHELGKELTRKCETLIQHQHLQHQGWAAVVANLDDVREFFNSKVQAFSTAYESFFKEFGQESVDQFLDSLDNTLKTLDAIKLPNQQTTNNNHNPSAMSSTSSSPQQKSIAEWLSEHFPQQQITSPLSATSPPPSLSTAPTVASSYSPLQTHLTSISTSTRKTYDHLNSPSFLAALLQEATAVSEKASSQNMKEIKGLEERLYGLDQLLSEAKTIVVDQNELTQAFHANVSRATDLKDPSIYVQLATSHQHQLLVMYKNHTQLDDIRRRVARAKDELTSNLTSRLKWIAFVQKSLSETGGKISVFHESLKRLKINVSILHQVHTCESTFKCYEKELRTRSRVCRKLKSIAGSIAEFNSIAEAENTRREEQFLSTPDSTHFLSQAFGVLVSDREISSVKIPSITEYAYDEGDEDDEDQQMDTTTTTTTAAAAAAQATAAQIQSLESTIASLSTQNTSLEERIITLDSVLSQERTTSLQTKNQLLDSRQKNRMEASKIEKLSFQISELRKLIDEFRVREEEVIKLHADEIRTWEERVREVESKGEERSLELRRMLEFECAQKVKSLEDSHKLENEAMLNRFKLVNKTSSTQQPFSGSTERLVGGASSPTQHVKRLLSPTSSNDHHPNNLSSFSTPATWAMLQQQQHSPSSNLTTPSTATSRFIPSSSSSSSANPLPSSPPQQVVVKQPQRQLLFEEDDDDDDDDLIEDRSRGGAMLMEIGVGESATTPQQQRSRRSRRSYMMMVDSEDSNSGDQFRDRHALQHQQDGSLERADDAAAVLLGCGDVETDDDNGQNSSSVYFRDPIGFSSPLAVIQQQEQEIIIPERVMRAATRLHKLSRISISTCRVGSESNLFYWNDKFNSFTVYLNTNKNVHFLNSSSSSSANDRSPTPKQNQQALIKSLSKTQMFTALITDKEFCVARRDRNRYNVPQGFHFYRVKCRVIEVLDE